MPGLCRPCRNVSFLDARAALAEHNLACAESGEREYFSLNGNPAKRPHLKPETSEKPHNRVSSPASFNFGWNH